MTSLASLARPMGIAMAIRRVALFGRHVAGASIACHRSFLRRCSLMMSVEMP